MELEPNTLLAGRYRITDVLARGGMGVVYRAQDERLSRLVAIKTVRYQDHNLVLRLRREAQLLARLTHPNVVGLYDVGEHEGRPYLVTQFVDGAPLRQLLGRMTERRIAWVAEQIAHGLTAAHALGIVHRDLKPSNILVGDGMVRLLDFGIARHINDAALTRTETLLGTAAYISPEQLHGEPAGPGADIYALGLVLIECFSGRAAFAGTFAETVAARMIERPALPDELPEAWRELVTAMTGTDAGARPTAVTVATAVRALGRPQSAAAQMPVLPALGGSGEPAVDPRRVPLPAATGPALPPPPAIEPLPVGAWDEPGDEPLRRRPRLARPAVVVPAAAAIGFLAVLAVGGFTASGLDQSAIPGGASVAESAPPPVDTLPMTEAVPTTEAPQVLAAEVTVPSTTVPPSAPRSTTTAPAPPPPPSADKPASTRVPTTRAQTATTEGAWARWMREWRRRR